MEVGSIAIDSSKTNTASIADLKENKAEKKELTSSEFIICVHSSFIKVFCMIHTHDILAVIILVPCVFFLMLSFACLEENKASKNKVCKMILSTSAKKPPRIPAELLAAGVDTTLNFDKDEEIIVKIVLLLHWLPMMYIIPFLLPPRSQILLLL